MSDPEAADAAEVTHTTIGRWKQGYGKGWKTLHAGTRRKLLEYLGRQGTSVNGSHERAAHQLDTEGAGLEMPDVWERIDEINRNQALSETARLLRVEQILAAGRMALQHREARVAELRTRAIERETEAAESRTRAVEREAEFADSRLLHIPGTAPTESPEEQEKRRAEMVDAALRARRGTGRKRRDAAGE